MSKSFIILMIVLITVVVLNFGDNLFYVHVADGQITNLSTLLTNVTSLGENISAMTSSLGENISAMTNRTSLAIQNDLCQIYIANCFIDPDPFSTNKLWVRVTASIGLVKNNYLVGF